MIPALMPTYNRANLAFEKGDGAWLIATDGKRYLDFGAGIATSSLGHGHPHLARAIQEQAAHVIHVSNLYRIPQAERMAERLVAASFADSVFFCNSGAEANEGMVKIIRRAQYGSGHPERTRILCFDGAFHGRTLAMLAATGNPKYQEGFGPVVDGFDHAPLNDLEAVKRLITPQTAGIILEPIQGESGIRSADTSFLRALRTLCDEHGIFLGFDEIQSGMGRTGRLFAHEWAGITPDIASCAKGIGGGVALGAVLTTEKLARHMAAGSHGTTFGGSPLACAAGNAVLDVILAPGFLDQVQDRARQLHEGLTTLVRDFPTLFTGLRGRGLMLGLACAQTNTDIQAAGLHEGILTVAAGDNALRLLPPLTLTEDECAEGLTRLRRVAHHWPQHMEGSAA